MFDDLSVRKKLYGGFGAVIAILLVLLLLFYGNFAKLTDANNWDRHSLEVLLATDGVEADIIDVQAEYRGFLLTNDERFLTQMEENQKDMERHFQGIHTLTSDNPRQQEKIKQMLIL